MVSALLQIVCERNHQCDLFAVDSGKYHRNVFLFCFDFVGQPAQISNLHVVELLCQKADTVDALCRRQHVVYARAHGFQLQLFHFSAQGLCLLCDSLCLLQQVGWIGL